MHPSRARLIIIRDDAIALIERRRADGCYHVFPGGGVEPGETPAAAAAREAAEELGLLVRVGACVAAYRHPDGVQHFFLADPVGGAFGEGTGAEMTGARSHERGDYRPLWVPLARLPALDLRPRAVARLVLAARARGWTWPTPALAVDDEA